MSQNTGGDNYMHKKAGDKDNLILSTQNCRICGEADERELTDTLLPLGAGIKTNLSSNIKEHIGWNREFF